MIYKKADILVSSILSVIISAIVLIFLIYTFTGFFENPQNKYNQAGLICSASFKNIPSNYQNETSLREYFKISSEVCISKTIETNFVVREIAGLLDSCWTRTGNGEDFLPNLVSDLSVCVYCGSVVAKNDGVFGNDLIQNVNMRGSIIYGIKTNSITNLEKVKKTYMHILWESIVLTIMLPTPKLLKNIGKQILKKIGKKL